MEKTVRFYFHDYEMSLFVYHLHAIRGDGDNVGALDRIPCKGEIVRLTLDDGTKKSGVVDNVLTQIDIKDGKRCIEYVVFVATDDYEDI